MVGAEVAVAGLVAFADAEDVVEGVAEGDDGVGVVGIGVGDVGERLQRFGAGAGYLPCQDSFEIGEVDGVQTALVYLLSSFFELELEMDGVVGFELGDGGGGRCF